MHCPRIRKTAVATALVLVVTAVYSITILFRQLRSHGHRRFERSVLEIPDKTFRETPFTVCENMSALLKGNITVDETLLSEEEILQENQQVQPGGQFEPATCTPKQKLAVIVPFRDRPEHLNIFLRNMHPLLQRQQRAYTIFVVEQSGSEKFNKGCAGAVELCSGTSPVHSCIRCGTILLDKTVPLETTETTGSSQVKACFLTGRLLDAGFREAQRARKFDCFVFHDVDLLPESDHIMYECRDQPVHLAVAVDKLGYKLPYHYMFGGAVALSEVQFQAVNGYSTAYWGWGAEDDDFGNRIAYHGMKILRPPEEIARFKMLKHDRDARNPVNADRLGLLQYGQERSDVEGLSSLSYRVLKLEQRPLFTRIVVDVGRPPTLSDVIERLLQIA